MALLKLMTEKLRELEIYKEEKQLYKINLSIGVGTHAFSIDKAINNIYTKPIHYKENQCMCKFSYLEHIYRKKSIYLVKTY